MEDFCRPIRQARNRAVLQSAQALAQAGYPVSEKRLLAQAGPQGQLCKQYLMAQLMEADLCKELYGACTKSCLKGKPPPPLCSSPQRTPWRRSNA